MEMINKIKIEQRNETIESRNKVLRIPTELRPEAIMYYDFFS
jgi:hypothetical protein